MTIKKNNEQMSTEVDKKIRIIPAGTFFGKIGDSYHFKCHGFSGVLSWDLVENSEIFEDVDPCEFLKESMIEKIYEEFYKISSSMHERFFHAESPENFEKEVFKMFGKAIFPDLIKEGSFSKLFKKKELKCSAENANLLDSYLKSYYHES